MKALSILFILLIAVYTGAGAASISGTISYAGASTGQVSIFAFTDTTSGHAPAAIAAISAPGSYSITGLADGTYYLMSVMTNRSLDNVAITDPWGYYGTGHLSPVTLSGGADVFGIDITLADGTLAHPNPFYRAYLAPALTLPLPAYTGAGIDPSIFSMDSSIYLYKHDSSGAASAKVFKINPSTGAVTATIILSLESTPNRICWIDKIIMHNGVLWAIGGYGDPSGLGYVNGIFTIDLAASTSSNQIPADTGIDLSNELGSFTSDGVNFYVGVTLKGTQPSCGVVKFNPSIVSKIPVTPFFSLAARPSFLCYGDASLWAGVDSVKKMDPANGAVLASYNMPRQAAGMYQNNMFWMYDENDSTIKAFSIGTVGVAQEKSIPVSSFELSQNYPNPFNPSTTIHYGLPVRSTVRLVIYNILGQLVQELVNTEQPAGMQSVVWNAQCASGLYFYRLEAASTDNPNKKFVEMKKMVYLK